MGTVVDARREKKKCALFVVCVCEQCSSGWAIEHRSSIVVIICDFLL